MKAITAVLLWCASMVALAGEPVWVDVRTPGEFSSGHVDVATNIPHGEVATGVPALVSDKNAEILLYCRSGNRAGIAKRALEDLGYTNVKNLGGLEDARRYHADHSPM